jgi:hypothetical protein
MTRVGGRGIVRLVCESNRQPWWTLQSEPHLQKIKDKVLTSFIGGKSLHGIVSRRKGPTDTVATGHSPNISPT